MRNDLERSLEKRFPTQEPLQLAAGRPRQISCGDQGDGADVNAVGVRDGGADVGEEMLMHGFTRIHFRDDGDRFLTGALDVDGKRGHAARPHSRIDVFGRELEIVGVVLESPDDQHILDASGYEQLAVALESEIAGPEERTLAMLFEIRLKSRGGFLGTVPVAPGNAVARNPDLTDLPGYAVRTAHWIRDDDLRPVQ